ncbi:MAG: cytochrome c oxidase assembly protein [Brachybacterium sp.]|nr:cytochrome c oxidase assembly protein [Brachybacterium sp.]
MTTRQRPRRPHPAQGSRTQQTVTPARTAPGPLIALVALILVVVLTGAAAPSALAPAPWWVSWGIPVVRTVHHLAVMTVIGAGGVVVLLMPAASRREGTRLSGGRLRLTRLAAGAALVWAGTSLALMLLSAAEALGPRGQGSLVDVALGTELGRTQVAVAILAGIAALLFALTRTSTGAAFALVFATGGVLALGLAGHAGASLDHTNAVNSMALHLLAVTTWGGGLLVMLCCSTWIGEAMPEVVRRFSPWALAAVVALAISGLVNAAIRLETPGQLLSTGYGSLVLAKTIGLVVLAGYGFLQRRRLGDAVRFRHLALSEGALLLVVVGLSIALGRTAPPVPQVIAPVGDQRVLSLVGYEPPAEPFNPATLFTAVHPDWIAIVAALTMAGLYIAGVVRLRRRGDTWPLLRVVLFLAGCVALIWITSGGPGAYGRFRFDAHMVQHMALMMIAPPLWVLSAPVTLLTRAVPPRTDGSRGIREWVIASLHTRYARIVSSPPVAGVLFAGSLIVFYFTPLFPWAMASHVGHVVMMVHFLLAGYLFAWVLIGVDPSPHSINPLLKLVTLLVTMSFHAFFGIAVVATTWIIGASWYEALGLYDTPELMLQQARGGSIMWGISELPSLLYAVILAFQWTRSEERRARQYDRKAARDGDAELQEYNAYLQSLQGRD